MKEELPPEFNKLWDFYELDENGNPPSLHEDLIEAIYTDGEVKHLKHPLVFSIFYTPLMNANLNKQYEYKLEAIDRALKEENYNTFIWLHERPYRLYAFQEISYKLEDDEYWKLLSDIWTDTENMWQNLDEWVECLNEDREGQTENFMDETERKTLASLPEKVRIFRGTLEGNAPGLSWTLDRKRAEWFARRLARGNKPVLISAWVRRDDIIAYLSARNEDEIIILPESAYNKRTKFLESEKSEG